ncbi:MAG: prepilin peptidase, partial [Deltaproteobacteria bacterium]|nr:prepilin peptidase [Deltaproteobacteria bacterium]
AAGYYYLRKKEGMGGGDIKLLAMIGAFLGWKGALVALVVGAFAGSIVGVTVMLIKGKDMKYAIPFGPFLSLGALCSLLYGAELLHWYLTLGRG